MISNEQLNQLERLGALRDRGVLSPSEFEAEKQRILRAPTSPGLTPKRGSVIQSASDTITNQLGLERLEPLTVKHLFSEVFRKHDPDAIENILSVGTSLTTPILTPSVAVTPTPWIFFRILLTTLLTYGIFIIAWGVWENPKLLPGLIIIGAFAVPFSMIILFFELNTPRNISAPRAMNFLFVGGAASLLFTLVIGDLIPLFGVFGASAAGLIEEPAKLLAVVITLSTLPRERYPYRLNALLFGACVGAGFAAFETAGYALTAGDEARAATLTVRGLLAPFGHVIWTAITSVAYWTARRDSHRLSDILVSPKFLPLMFTCMALHFVWNMNFTGPFMIKFWVLGAIGWVIVLSLIQMGLREVSEAAATPQP